MKKKRIIIVLVLVVLLAAGAGAIYYFGIPGFGSDIKIYVESVADITELGSGNGVQNRYAGVVESQDIWNISENPDKTVKEIYVKEGDTVEVGDKLFAYDNEEAELNLAQAKLELERMQNEIKAGEVEIANLEKEKQYVSSSDQIEYTIQIASQKALNKKTEYEIKSQEAKIKSLEEAAKDSVVKSEMAGVVKTINESAISDEADITGYSSGDSAVFMSILATGDYRIKASINEQNRWTIEDGQEVIVRSRVDENAKWTGKIATVDSDNPEISAENEYDTSGDDMTVSSNYSFYVELESSVGLILGQHVYVELDEGQDEKKDGIWLDSYYILQEEIESDSEEDTREVQSYVWVEGPLKLLEKRIVTLGDYDIDLDKFEIVSGLTEDDYIAFPAGEYKAGMHTTRNIEEAATEEGGSEENTGESLEYEDDEIFQEFEGDDGISDEEETDESGPVGSIPWFAEVLL